MCGIYKITNLLNNKVYIGQSINILKRWTSHSTEYSNPNSKAYNYALYRAIRKYGINNFSFQIVEICDSTQLDELEKHYIELFNSFKNGYNENKGGQNIYGHPKLTEEQVLEIKKKLFTQKYTLTSLSEEYGVHKDTIRDINNGQSWRTVGSFSEYPLYISYSSPLYEKKKYFCPLCGKEKSPKGTLCRECTNKKQIKGNYPDKSQIYQDIKTLGFTGASKIYGVSDNALKKHCVKIGLPKYRKDYI